MKLESSAVSKISLGEELLRLAVEIEKNGRALYSSQAGRTRDKDVQGEFVYLAEQEKQHEETFSAMLGRLGSFSAAKSFGKQYSYLKDLANESIFTPEKVEAVINKKVRTDVEAVEIGIAFEKDSILFYSEMRGMFPADEQPAIDIVTEEERKHLSELSYIRRRLTGG